MIDAATYRNAKTSTLIRGLAILGLVISQASSSEVAAKSLRRDSQYKSQEADSHSDADIRARAKILIANQHKNDDALNEYERIERHEDRTGGSNPRIIEDRTYRVVPTGGGTMKILLKDGSADTNPEEYRRQLQAWEDVLQMMLRPNDSRAKTASEKYSKRQQERAQLVDAMNDAYNVKWLRQESVDGHDCDVYQLDPSPSYHPHSIFQEALTHVSVTIWVDRTANQLVRGQARVTRDISIGGGILGKLYKGGTFSMDQAELAPGVWLPVRYQYNFSGRKFVVSFEEHQLIDASHYKYIGPTKEALALVQNELASGKTFSADP